MKKTLYFGLFFFALIAICASCSNKDGHIKTKQKISTVYAESDIYNNNVLQYHMDSHIVQHWLWEGNELYRIEYTEDYATYAENIFYDYRNRIIRTTVPAYGIKSEFQYKGRELENIKVYTNDTLSYTLTFTHTQRHISQVVQEFSSTNTSTKALELNPVHLLTSSEMANNLANYAIEQCQIQRQHKGNNPLSITYQFLWDDDNVSSITPISPEETSTMSFTYDDYRNPYKECYTLYEMEDNELGTNALQDNYTNSTMLSKNNTTCVTRAFNHNPNFKFNYNYTYEGKYPTTRTLNYTYQIMDNTTFEDMLVTVIEKRTYIYE